MRKCESAKGEKRAVKTKVERKGWTPVSSDPTRLQLVRWAVGGRELETRKDLRERDEIAARVDKWAADAHPLARPPRRVLQPNAGADVRMGGWADVFSFCQLFLSC